jgi:hypothetical protein
MNVSFVGMAELAPLNSLACTERWAEIAKKIDNNKIAVCFLNLKIKKFTPYNLCIPVYIYSGLRNETPVAVKR